MTGKEITKAIKHLLHQLSHGHHVEQYFDEEKGVFRFSLVGPRRGGFNLFGKRRSQPVPAEVIFAARERGAFKLWRDNYGRHSSLRQSRKLTRREMRRKQNATRRAAIFEEQRRQERKANPYFVDLYYREGPDYAWKPYFPEPLTISRSRHAWNTKEKLRKAPRTRHLQTVIISGPGDLRDPNVAGRMLEEAAARYEQGGIL